MLIIYIFVSYITVTTLYHNHLLLLTSLLNFSSSSSFFSFILSSSISISSLHISPIYSSSSSDIKNDINGNKRNNNNK